MIEGAVIFSLVLASVFIGLKLARMSVLKRRIKQDEKILDMTAKINKDLRETIDKIDHDRTLSDSDISRMLGKW